MSRIFYKLQNPISPELLPPTGTNVLVNSAFATYVLSWVFYTVYLIHGIIPEQILRERLSITYYPSKNWSLVLPAWLTVTAWFIFLVYGCRNLIVTPPMDGRDGLRAILDNHSIVLDRLELINKSAMRRGDEKDLENYDLPVPILRDLPCQVVNRFYLREKSPGEADSNLIKTLPSSKRLIDF